MTRRRRTGAVVVGFIALAVAGATGPAAGAAGRTCSDVLGVEVHGQHVVGDYVTGVGHDTISWPPVGGVVGEAVAGTGAALPGGPGPGFHFPAGVAPGASFCTGSSSPGIHL